MVIKIKDWKGTELINDFIDYVNTGTANAKAIASQVTGSMVGSVKIEKTSRGYLVYSDKDTLKRLSGQTKYYTYTYAKVGYPRYAPFDFIVEGFKAIDDERIGRKYNWNAVGGRNRRGSGRSTIRGIKIPKRLRKLND